jgi:hypothetical protein
MKPTATALRRCALVGAAAALATTTIAGVAPAQTDHLASTSTLAVQTPMLTLKNAAQRVTLERYGKRVALQLGIYAVAGDQAFEVRAHRPTWDDPIHAFLETPGGELALPDDAMTDFSKLRQFYHLTFTNRAGDVVFHHNYGFCPAGESVRVDPESPSPTKPYPSYCPYNPYTKGGVYGISPGFGLPALLDYGHNAQLQVGHYTATLKIRYRYAHTMGLTPTDSTSVIKVDVIKNDGDDCRAESSVLGCKSQPSNPFATAQPKAAVSAAPAQPATASTCTSVVPPGTPLPDLQSLPAYSIGLHKGYIRFAATVWNAGTSPMVVDGFRRADEDVMDACQYFYDSDGQELGHAPAGAMEWDSRPGHEHWHFRDFAKYVLLDADKNQVVRSRKEAFCLANTDAVDYTVDGANWNPYNTDLHTACGSYTALGVREVLDSGNGDTYYQGLPGQSFNVKDLPNGVYFIAVVANPKGKMLELESHNNTSYRKIILKGKDDNRRVVVPQKGIIDENNLFY